MTDPDAAAIAQLDSFIAAAEGVGFDFTTTWEEGTLT